MQLSFLIQLVLLFLLVICVYLVFTNNVEGRMKLIVIVFCVVIGLYLYSKLNLFKDYNEYYSTPTSAKEEYIIDKDLLKKSDGQFTISTWVFIDDWNYKYGEKKVILQKTVPSSTNSQMQLPSIELGGYKNDLIVRLDTYSVEGGGGGGGGNGGGGGSGRGGASASGGGDGGTETETGLSSCGTKTYEQELIQLLNDADITYSSSDEISCNDGYIYTTTDGNTGISCDTPNTLSSQNVNLVESDTIVENINMQKWVNVITSVSNRSIDIYINGKLIKTKTFNNLIDAQAFNLSLIHI